MFDGLFEFCQLSAGGSAGKLIENNTKQKELITVIELMLTNVLFRGTSLKQCAGLKVY